MSANAGYFDFGSFEEFQLGGAGNDAAQDVPGASLNITVKSGGDRFQGTFYSDYENDSTIGNNVPDAFRTPNTKDDDGFFTKAANGLQTGNPIDRAVRHQLQHRRADLEGQGLVLLFVPAERSVPNDHQLAGDRAVEADATPTRSRARSS